MYMVPRDRVERELSLIFISDPCKLVPLRVVVDGTNPSDATRIQTGECLPQKSHRRAASMFHAYVSQTYIYIV